jgi:P4 family phage/plasmid primase-like protien
VSEIVQSIYSARPFGATAQEYFDLGWRPVYLPEKEKFPPPTGYSGKLGAEITQELVTEWIEEHPKGNVGLVMQPVSPPMWYVRHCEKKGLTPPLGWYDEEGDPNYTVVGIDVDDYVKGDSKKEGGAELKALEEELGPLPDTWISTARDDGVSGIRFYLFPVGYSCRGQAAKSIEIVSYGYRFAAVGPSVHPDAGSEGDGSGDGSGAAGAAGGGGGLGVYRWFAPGCAPQGQGSVPRVQVAQPTGNSTGAKSKIVTRNGVAPQPWTLPVLPEEWFEYITRDKTPWTENPIDMDIEVDDLWQWAQDTFTQDGGGWSKGTTSEERASELSSIGCRQVLKSVAKWRKAIEDDPTSHDKLVDGHWNVLNYGAEGHSGWNVGARVLEDAWVEHVLSEGKRGMEEARMEMFRSRTNGLRKVKARVDEYLERGVSWTNRLCACAPNVEYEASELADELGFVDPGMADLDSFDDGGGLGLGSRRSHPSDPGSYEMNDDGNAEHLNDLFPDRFHFVEGYGQWIFWDGAKWSWDKDGKHRRAWRIVKERQQQYAINLYAKAQQAKAMDSPDAEQLGNAAKAWMSWAKKSGTNAAANNAVEAMSSIYGVWMGSDVPDGNEYLLGVSNGIIELSGHGAELRQAEAEDMVVNNTGTEFMELSEQLKAGGEIQENAELFAEALRSVQPDEAIRKYLQQLLGMCLVGFNPKKKLIFFYGDKNTGKSTLLNTVSRALGRDYVTAARMSIFNGRDLNPQLAYALSSRIVVISEAAGRQGADSEMLKSISGNDEITAELKGENRAITRVPAFTVIFAANGSPELDNYDEALRDRVEVIPFEVEQKKSDKGHDIEERCGMAALAWMVDGWRMFCSEQLRERPPGIEKIRSRFDENVTPLGAFISEMLEQTGEHDDWEARSNLYQAYKAWCEATNEKPFSQRKFGLEMSASGFPSVVIKPKGSGRAVRGTRGVKISAPEALTFSRKTVDQKDGVRGS